MSHTHTHTHNTPPSSPLLRADTAYVNLTARINGCTGEPGEWYHFDDHKCSRISLDARNAPVVGPDAYVMLYALRNGGNSGGGGEGGGGGGSR